MCGRTLNSMRLIYLHQLMNPICHAQTQRRHCGVLGKLNKYMFKRKKKSFLLALSQLLFIQKSDNSLVTDLHRSVKQRLNKLTSLLLIYWAVITQKMFFQMNPAPSLINKSARREQSSRKRQNDWPCTFIHQMTLMENDANDKAADDTRS